MDIAVIGTGAMGRNHVRVLSELGRLAAIVDPVNDVAGPLAEKFGVPLYEDVETLLRETKLNGAVVATPTQYHARISNQLMDKGLAVMTEKPMAGSVEDALALHRRAEKEGLILAVGHIERFNPVVAFSKKMITDDKFGTMYNISSKRVSTYPARIRDVGVVYDLAVHDIDVMRYLVGKPVEKVFATFNQFVNEQFEDFAYITLMFQGGVRGVLEVSWLTPNKVRALNMTFADYYVEVDYMEQSAELCTSRFIEPITDDMFDIPRELNRSKIMLKKQEPLKLELQDFCDAVDGKKKPLVGGMDGVMAMRIAEGALVSAREGRAVDILEGDE